MDTSYLWPSLAHRAMNNSRGLRPRHCGAPRKRIGLDQDWNRLMFLISNNSGKPCPQVIPTRGRGREGVLTPSCLRLYELQFEDGNARVREGDVLGRLGNSGGSPAPHLHFPVTNGLSVFSEGIPFVFRSFDTAGECRNSGGSFYGRFLPGIAPEYFDPAGKCAHNG
jgi:hypothetical protein